MKPVILDYPVVTRIWTFPVLQAALREAQRLYREPAPEYAVLPVDRGEAP